MLTRSQASTLLLLGAIILAIQCKGSKSANTTSEQELEMTTTLEEEITTPRVEPIMSTSKPKITGTSTDMPTHTAEHTTPTDISTPTADSDTPKDEDAKPVTTESVPVYDEAFLRWFNGTEWSNPECQDAVLVRYGEPDLEDLNCGSVNMFLQFSHIYNCDRNEKCQMLKHLCKNSADIEKEFIKANIKVLCE